MFTTTGQQREATNQHSLPHGRPASETSPCWDTANVLQGLSLLCVPGYLRGRRLVAAVVWTRPGWACPCEERAGASAHTHLCTHSTDLC